VVEKGWRDYAPLRGKELQARRQAKAQERGMKEVLQSLYALGLSVHTYEAEVGEEGVYCIDLLLALPSQRMGLTFLPPSSFFLNLPTRPLGSVKEAQRVVSDYYVKEKRALESVIYLPYYQVCPPSLPPSLFPFSCTHLYFRPLTFSLPPSLPPSLLL
jgi:hypothetical protein